MTHKRRSKRKSCANEFKPLINQIKRSVRLMRGTADEDKKRAMKKRADNAWRQMQRVSHRCGGNIPHVAGYQPPNH